MAGFEKGCQVVRIREFIERVGETGRITDIVELLNEHRADVILSGMQVGSCAVGCASSQGKRTAGVRRGHEVNRGQGVLQEGGKPDSRQQHKKARAEVESGRAEQPGSNGRVGWIAARQCRPMHDVGTMAHHMTGPVELGTLDGFSDSPSVPNSMLFP